ncbi:MAG: polyprenyl diphosphate synthase [archaeon]|nr:polyprenyl diphosphate synthase [archaeon]
MTEDKAIPKHIVLFPDGNRRWAKERNLHTLEGHKKGGENFEQFMGWCKARGVETVTVFGFSTENWKRSEEEVSYLMELFETILGSSEQIARYNKEGVRVRVLGQRDKLSLSLLQAIERVEKETENNTEFSMNLAVSYGGRWDIVNAARQIAKEGGEITEEAISEHLSTAGQSEPDLIIRAGGEKRLSNFVLWQGPYSELYFSSKYWPDFNEQDLQEALDEYARRQRRFGK